MEWHESLREILARGAKQGKQHTGNNDEDDNDATAETKPLAQEEVADLLVVDNAKAHRRVQESQSTVAETRSSSSSASLDELSILFEEVDLYDDEQEGLQAEMHRSFPVTHHSRRRRRRRRRSEKSAEKDDDDDDDVEQLLEGWGSNSDSLLDYNSLDDMLREENSQTASAKSNVFQPERRRSFEVSLLEFEDMSELMSVTSVDDDSDMDCKPPATVPSP